MKLYVVIMGESFEKAKEAHGDNYFTSVEDAVNWAKLMLEPNKRFWVCDENGGVLQISSTARLVGRS
jgi:hypothetical protein